MIAIIAVRLWSLLWLALFAMSFAASVCVASIEKSGCTVVYDGEGHVNTRYDGGSLLAFNYDSAVVSITDRERNRTASIGGANSLIDKCAEFLAAEGTASITTPYAVEAQSASAEAQAALSQAQNGATPGLYT
jgi:hypothetical protein